MLNLLLKELLRPRSNRYYLGDRLHRIQFFIYNGLTFLVVSFVAATNITLLWWLPLVAIGFMILEYFYFDKFRDMFEWKLLKRIYGSAHTSPKDVEFMALMKDYEKQPTPQKRDQIAKLLEKSDR